MVLLYYFQFMFRSMIGTGRSPSFSGGRAPFVAPSIEVIAAVVFGAFACLNLILMLGALAPRGGFRPADVDVLFATPLNPRLVLLFRMFRDYLITLIFPFFIALLTGRGGAAGYDYLFQRLPQHHTWIGPSVLLAWFLLALSWVCVGYGLSLFINRSDDQSDRNKVVINWALYGTLFAAIAYVGLSLQSNLSWASAMALTESPFLKIAFFPATFASFIVTGAIEGSVLMAVVGAGSLIAVSGLGIWLAMTQVGYMYDQAAAKGFDSVNLRKLQQSGDQYGMIAEHARRGKIKTGKIAGKIARWKVRGGATLMWKELLLQARGAMFQYYIFGPLVLLLVLVPLYGASRSESITAESWMLIGFLALGTFMITMNNATSGFIELLRRVDLQKPLPFSPSQTVFWEIAAKAVPTTLICLVASVASVIIDTRLASVALATLLMIPTLALVLTAVVLLVTILFPDVEDATQRSFRGLMILLGSAIAASPGGIVLLVMFGALQLNPLFAAVPVLAINLGMTAGISAIAGAMYAGFNPSE